MKANSAKGAIETQPVPAATLRNLVDKSYDKRKQAAQEIEQQVREAREQNDRTKIEAMIEFLSTHYVNSQQTNPRKGGILGLAACAIGLGQDASGYLATLAPPVLRCFTDSDSKIRFYACESLYNIAKVSRSHMLVFFNDIFDGLCRLSADSDPQVISGSVLLDRLMKDIVAEGALFDITHFIPLLRERSLITNPQVRQFLLTWITVLDSVPEINMVYYLPEYLDGLFKMLSDKQMDIRSHADTVLSEFLKQITANPGVLDLGRVVTILVPFCAAKDETTQLVALFWLISFLDLPDPKPLLPLAPEMLSGILPCVSQESSDVRNQALRANVSLQSLLAKSPTDFDMERFLTVLSAQFVNRNVPTRTSALTWILKLHERAPDELLKFVDQLYPVLLKTLTDTAEDVISLDLEVLAKLTKDRSYFRKLMSQVVHLFSVDQQLLENRGNLIIRQLCLHIRPRKIFKAISAVLLHDLREEDHEFASLMVQTLNIILLTSAELAGVREALKDLTVPENRKLFEVLYRSWSHNAVSTIALCLYARAYEHATNVVLQFSRLEVTVTMLLEVDRLVQLLESPIYTDLRLHLLEPHQYPFLYKCLYALMLLLPQTTAFHTLRARLESVAPIVSLNLLRSVEADVPDTGFSQVDFASLLSHFVSLQKSIEKRRTLEVSEKSSRARGQILNQSSTFL